MLKIYKYDVLLVDLNPTKWHEQKGLRPCVVLQSNLINNVLSITIVAPVTSNLVKWPSCIVIDDYKKIWLTWKSKILFHQIKVIDEKRIVKKIWKITDDKLIKAINEKIELVFDISDMF